MIMPTVINFHVLKNAVREQIVFYTAERTLNGFLLIFIFHYLHLLASLWWLLSLKLSCKHLPLVLIHSIFKAVLHSVFYHSDNLFHYSFLLLFLFCLSFLFFSISNSIPISPLDIDRHVLIPFLVFFLHCRI